MDYWMNGFTKRAPDASNQSIHPSIQKSTYPVSFFLALEKFLHRLPLFRQNHLRMGRTAAGGRVVERTMLCGRIVGAQLRRALAHADELGVG